VRGGGNLFLFLVHSEDALHQNTHTRGQAGRQAGRRCLISAIFLGEFGGNSPAWPDGVRPALSKDLEG